MRLYLAAILVCVHHFIPFLMEHLGEKYYAGLLSAGEYHGAAHQRPQVYQVVTARNRPQINCGRVRVQFIARKNMEQIPTSDLMTPHGYLKVSTPAATAFDLVGYFHSAAGSVSGGQKGTINSGSGFP
jgi:hypothetical protein